ncbi:MAG: ATP-binding protein [Ideonella sp.]|nr:ATP-binding protein [Ideonella sp.]
MSRDAQLTLPASMASWPRAQGFVEAFCARHRVGRHDMLRLTLVAEELFTNAVEHGHGGDADAPVRLALAFEPGRLRLLVEDRAPPFDPIAHARSAPPEHAVELDARKVGGLGLLLVEQLAAELRYAREHGCNRLWVTLAIESAAGDADQGPALPR